MIAATIQRVGRSSPRFVIGGESRSSSAKAATCLTKDRRVSRSQSIAPAIGASPAPQGWTSRRPHCLLPEPKA